MKETTVHIGLSPLALAAAVLLTGLGPRNAEAAACLYRGTDADARVIGSGTMTTPFPDAASASDCSRLKVASGTVDVYVLGADRAAIAARRVGVDDGVLVRASSADKVRPGETSSLLLQFLVMLEGDQRSRTGSSRGAGEDYLLAALPTGLIATPAVDLVVPLGPVADANLLAFELLVDGKPAVRLKGPSSALALPAAALKPGAHAVWKLDYAGKRREGSFDVVPVERLAALKASLATESGPGDDARVAQLRVAAGLVESGFAWDARDLIRAAIAH